MIDLTIIIPCFNEELAILNTVEKLTDDICKNNLKWTILVVDDGSTDNSLNEIKKFKSDIVEVIEHPYNKGYGASLKTGIKHAKSKFVAFFDADGQHSFEDLFNMSNNINKADMIIGERGKDSHSDWIRRPGKWLLSKVANYLTETKIPDLNSGLRIIRREIIVRLLHLLPQGFSFSTTSTIAFYNFGYNIHYFPIKVKKRIGKSSVKQLTHGPQTIMLILRLIVLFNPLKIFLPVSLYSFLLGLIYELIYGIILLPGTVRLIPAALFMMITSVLIFFFGLVVDQISELRKNLKISGD